MNLYGVRRAEQIQAETRPLLRKGGRMRIHIQALTAWRPAVAGIGVQMDVRLVGKDDKRALVLLRLRDQLAQLLDKFRAPRRRGFAEQLVRLFVLRQRNLWVN